MEANAALRNIVRRDTGEGYRGMLERFAQESGIETPTAEDRARLDRKRKGKKLSNQDWVSRSDPEAKIAKMKLTARPIWPTSLSTRWIWTPARWWRPSCTPPTRATRRRFPRRWRRPRSNLASVDAAPTAEDPAECVTDKGYHSRAVLNGLGQRPVEDADRRAQGEGLRALARRRGGAAGGHQQPDPAVIGGGQRSLQVRAEIVERSFAHNLDRGGMRRTWLRGRENVHKRYHASRRLPQPLVADGQLIGAGTPREAVAGGYGGIFVLLTPIRGRAGRTGRLAKRPDG